MHYFYVSNAVEGFGLDVITSFQVAKNDILISFLEYFVVGEVFPNL